MKIELYRFLSNIRSLRVAATPTQLKYIDEILALSSPIMAVMYHKTLRVIHEQHTAENYKHSELRWLGSKTHTKSQLIFYTQDEISIPSNNHIRYSDQEYEFGNYNKTPSNTTTLKTVKLRFVY